MEPIDLKNLTIAVEREADGTIYLSALLTIPPPETPPPPPPALPVAVTDFKAEPISDSEIALSWVHDGQNVTAFRLDRAMGGLTTWSSVATGTPDDRGYRDTGLVEKMDYRYRVVTINGLNESTGNLSAEATTLPKVIEPPPPVKASTPTDVTALPIAPDEIDVSWVHDGIDIDGFSIERDDGDRVVAQIGHAGPTVRTFPDKSVAPNTTYNYVIVALRPGANSDPSDPVTVKTPPPVVIPPAVPNPPTDLAATTTTKTIDLSWKHDGQNVTGFEIEFSADGSAWQLWATMTTADARAYTVTGLTPDHDYWLAVRSFYDASAIGVNSDVLKVHTQATILPPPPPVDPLDSPTGRNPRVLWSRERQGVWGRMRAENHPWWGLILDRANATGTKNESYNDLGEWAMIAYQITGDRAFADKAIAKGLPVITAEVPGNRNYIRENFILYPLMFEWLYPALSADQKAQWVAGLNHWCDWCLSNNTTQYLGGNRVTDSDQTIGQYFGMALIDLMDPADNPKAGTWLAQTSRDNFSKKPTTPVGGLDATGANFTTSIRNALANYVREAKGGIWIESSEYNADTPRLFLTGSHAVKDLTGVDHYPEFTAFLPDFARGLIADLTPDLADNYQWGDDENPHMFRDRFFHRITTLGMLSGALKDDPIGPVLQGLINEFTTRFGYRGYKTAEPWPRIFWFYDPYAPASPDWRAGAPLVHYAEGAGQLKIHTGWGTDDSFFAARMSTRVGVDHETFDFADVQAWRKNEWVLSHPIGYGTTADTNIACNSMLIAGLSSMFQRGPNPPVFGNGWTYFTGTTKGNYYVLPHYNNPAEFCHEWTRGFLYLPSPDKSCDVILCLDYVDAEDPRNLPMFVGYDKTAAALINGAKHLKEWLIHSPVEPVLNDGSFTWKTPKGQTVNVTTLLPAAVNRETIDEKILFAPVTNPVPSERKWQTRVSPAVDQRVDTLLHAITFSDGSPPSLTLLTPADATTLGVLVVRPGLSDVTVTFAADRLSVSVVGA